MKKYVVVSLIAGTVVASTLVARLFFALPKIAQMKRKDVPKPARSSELHDRTNLAFRAHAGLSSVKPLIDGRDGFAARAILARAANRTIDAQYYIWQDDVTGQLLLDELRRAADRGVRVRLLVDDNGIPGLDAALSELDRMPTAQVRLYNPFVLRKPKMLNYTFDFSRLNRRMHNKAMIFDESVAIIGGRNIGDVYFSYGDGTHYFDLDVALAGPVVAEASQIFEKFWEAESSYPISEFVGRPALTSQIILSRAESARTQANASPYVEYGENLTLDLLIDELLAKERWQNVNLVSDPPEKTLGAARDEELLLSHVTRSLTSARSRADLVSAYFVPGQAGMKLLGGMRKRDVGVRAVTNSLASTDVPPVHGAYSNYRKQMLEMGIELFELRTKPNEDTKINWAHRFNSSAALHGKTFAIDGKRMFIGSFNLDPRSARLNTEMGIFFDSEALAQELANAIDRPSATWRVELTGGGEMRWVQLDGASRIVRKKEPEAGFGRKALSFLSSILPIERLL